MGTIITFFSYKGGAGRTMALANIAVLLAKKGKKVLAVDWDLEAPGLDRYFDDYEVTQTNMKMGLLDLLEHAAASKDKYLKKPNWRKYVSKVYLSETESLDVIWTGSNKNSDYIGRVLKFDWNDFFEKQAGGPFIESLRDKWKLEYDFILIDSRTGITDSGGICTIQMPDILTIVFTPNYQSLIGVKDVALRSQKARQKLAYDRMPLLIYPLPSRFDGRVEHKESQKWLDIFKKELSEFYADWLPKEYSRLEVLEKTKLPHIPYFSFGEKLAVESSSLSDPESLGYAYSTMASLYENDFRNVTDLLRIGPVTEKSIYKKGIQLRLFISAIFGMVTSLAIFLVISIFSVEVRLLLKRYYPVFLAAMGAGLFSSWIIIRGNLLKSFSRKIRSIIKILFE